MKRHWQYLKYVVRHKWFVLLAGLNLGVDHWWQWIFWVWRLLIHDWTKFLPSEWLPYANYFYGNLPTRAESRTAFIVGIHVYTKEDAERDFAVAWNHHQKRNPHHWQYWMITWDKGNTECLPMPELYRREMIADWKGAGRAITGKDNTLNWYIDNYYKIQLHPDTRLWVDRQLCMGKDSILMTMGAEAELENCSVQDWRDYWHKLAKLRGLLSSE